MLDFYLPLVSWPYNISRKYLTYFHQTFVLKSMTSRLKLQRTIGCNARNASMWYREFLEQEALKKIRKVHERSQTLGVSISWVTLKAASFPPSKTMIIGDSRHVLSLAARRTRGVFPWRHKTPSIIVMSVLSSR